MKSTQAKLSRRNFLIALGAGGATAAAVAAKLVSQPESAATGTDRGKGYEETAHVRNYYRTTQV